MSENPFRPTWTGRSGGVACALPLYVSDLREAPSLVSGLYLHRCRQDPSFRESCEPEAARSIGVQLSADACRDLLGVHQERECPTFAGSGPLACPSSGSADAAAAPTAYRRASSAARFASEGKRSFSAAKLQWQPARWDCAQSVDPYAWPT